MGALFALTLAAAPAWAHETAAGSTEPENAARGVVHRDLVQATEPRCRGLLMGVRSGVCTHGPDPAPAGRDVRAYRSTADLRASAGLSPVPSVVNTTPGTSTAPTDGSGAIVCSGDGVSGKRVEVLYVLPAGQTDRYDSIKDALGQYVIRADRQLDASAAETSGSRHWRFVTDPDPAGVAPCVLRITKVAIGSADDDTFDATMTKLRSLGYNRADRKYLLYVESNVYCGIGSIYNDSQPGQANVNNGSYAQYARADAGCWNYAEAHELMHNLGGVQTNAPNATPGFHCTDENDEMCYDDDGSGPVVMRNVCGGRDGTLFDCNHDDYFLAGTPLASNYLATHWNTATSAFLIDPGFLPDTTPPAAPAGVAATPGAGQVTLSWTANGEADLAGYRVLRDGVQVASLGKVTSYVDGGLLASRSYAYVVRAVDSAGNVSADSATVGATPLPTTTSEQLGGSFKRTALSVAYTRTVQPGPLRGVASGSAKGKPATVTVTLRSAQGTVLATKSGTSVDVQATAAAAGAYSWTISGANGTSYALTISYGSS
ncbi:MAG: hypothetical protein QOJ85_4145 [Solirubrobacteraceae bacterium]|nr:hypothetical protein [Solirubrobacteraceae bacterium]